MSVVHLIDTVTAWARPTSANRCGSKCRRRMPRRTTPGMTTSLVTPATFAVYTPTSDKLPPRVQSPFPSLCVRILSGEDDLASGSGTAEVQFCFSAWDPGLHDKDYFWPVKDQPGVWHQGNGSEDFTRGGEGWRDAWNFVDVALRALESVIQIDGYMIDRSQHIKYGPLTEQESIPDFYPFWFAWVSFKINYPLVRNVEDFQKFL